MKPGTEIAHNWEEERGQFSYCNIPATPVVQVTGMGATSGRHPYPRVKGIAREKHGRGTSIKACKEWLKTHRHYPLPMLIPAMIRKVRGHYNYFRAIGNMTSLWIFYREVVKLLYKWLNRRSQRKSLTWDGIKRVLKAYDFPAPS